MKLKTKSGEIIINLDIYPLEAIYITSYSFVDRFYIFIDKVNNHIKVFLKPKENIKLSLNACKGMFMNELLNNSLRLMISKRTQKLREMIVKEALFFSQPKEEIESLLSDPVNRNDKADDWKKDPLGISDTWEKSQRKRNKKR